MLKQKPASKKSKTRQRGVPATLQVLPPAFKRSYLSYQAWTTVTEGAAGTGGLYTFRLNSIYDPDFTGVGGTAMGYTSLTSLYSLFRVVRVRVVARIALSTTGQAVVGMLAGLNSTFAANYHQLEAEPNSVSKLIVGNVGGAHGVANFDRTYDLAKVCGITPQQYKTDFDFSHVTGSNPNKNVFLTVYLAGASAAAQTMVYHVRLIYEVEVSNPLQSVAN